MRALLHAIQHRLARHGRAAGAWRDVLELLSATALCALLEGWWRLRYSDAMTVPAARLTLALLPIAPLALAAAAGGYLKAHRARLRRHRADLALYRVLGGDMRRAAGRQALSAALRLSIATAGGIGIALLLLPSLAVPNAPPALTLTTLAALAAGLAVAAHAAWRTWHVPAAYDLAASAAADDGTDEPGDEPDSDHAGGAIEQRLRALYAASPLLARRKPHPASRYRGALTPLLLAVYALLLDKHHQPQPHGDDNLAHSDDNHADTHHRATGWPDTADDVPPHHPRLSGTATPAPQLAATTEAAHASRPFPPIENGTVPWLLADAGHAAPSLIAGTGSPAASLQTTPSQVDPPHAATMGALAGIETAMNIDDTATQAAPHIPLLIKSLLSSTALAWSELEPITIAPLSNLQQNTVTQIGASDLLAVGALSSLQQTPLNNTSTIGLAINTISSISAQSTATLSQNSMGSQTALVETVLAAMWPIDAGAAHVAAASEQPPSSSIVLVGQPLDGHVSSLHLG